MDPVDERHSGTRLNGAPWRRSSPGELGEIDLEAKRRAIRPLGQWNTIEISSKDGHVQTRLNGVPVSSVTTELYDYAGHIVFQIQGAKMYWRNIRIRVDQ